jgi:hypothetical protein
MTLVLFLKSTQLSLFDAPVNVKAGVRGGKAVKPYTRVQKVAPDQQPVPRHVSDDEKAILARMAHNESVRLANIAAHEKKQQIRQDYWRLRDANPDAPPPGWEKLIAFENSRAGEPLEWGQALDDDGNLAIPGRGIQGTRSRVTMNQGHFNAVRGKIFTHGHPGDVSFSKGDWKCAAYQNAKEFRAIGARWVHSLKPTGGDGHQWPSPTAMVALYGRAEKEILKMDKSIIYPKAEAPAAGGRRPAGLEVFWHMVNQRAAEMSNGRVKYERTERT